MGYITITEQTTESATIRSLALSDYDIEVIITALNELSEAQHYEDKIRQAAEALIPLFEEQ